MQAAGLPVYDVESYLNDPKNQALLHSASKNSTAGPSAKKDNKGPSGQVGGTEPVQLGGPKTTHYTGVLNQLCQKKGLNPLFEIDGPNGMQGFGGRLKVGEEVVAQGLETRWQSKKEAREELARMGIERVKQMESHNIAQEKAENWIGRLLGISTAGVLFPNHTISSNKRIQS